ncbi:MAG: hypothetical protein JWN56_2865 [Sphingobacteriales bacterium]|nr:hypothetical protein [Sphingobacteriales bacterium]
MRHISISILLFFFISTSCKKTIVNIETPVRYTDSVSFSINGKNYVCNERHTSGAGNRQMNIKPSDTVITGRRWQYETGNFYWYGEKDSTLYSINEGFRAESTQGYASIDIEFNRKYGNNQLKRNYLLEPMENSLIFNKGKQPFAVDLNLENTMEGVSIEVYNKEAAGLLSTYIPGFSILINTKLPKSIQDDSSFQVTKIQLLENDIYLVEARFEVNLFDEKAKLYKLKNGFLRIKTSMKRYRMS